MINNIEKIEKEPALLEYPQVKLNHEQMIEEKANGNLNNGYLVPEIASKKAHQQFELEDQKPKSRRENQRSGNKRSQKGSKSRVGYRGRSFKLVSPEEFKEVVNGFMKFIDELNNIGKRKPKRSKKNKAQDKTKLTESVDNDKPSKKIKYNPDFKKLQPQSEQHNNDSNQIKEELSTNPGSVTIITQGNNENTALKIKKGVNGPKNRVKEAMDLEAVGKQQANQLKQKNMSIQKNARSMELGSAKSLEKKDISGTIMSESARMKQMFELLMMNNPKNLMSFKNSDINSFSREVIMKIQNPSLAEKINKIALESEKAVLKFQKSNGNSQIDPRKTLKRATLHVSLAYLIQTRKAENSKFEANKIKTLRDNNGSKGKLSVISKITTQVHVKSPIKFELKQSSKSSNIQTQARSSQFIEIESDEEKVPNRALETPIHDDSSKNNNPSSSQPAISTFQQSSGPQESCANQQRKEIENPAIIILD